MAIYHLTVNAIGRTSGRSSVAAAAYRSGSSLLNERDGKAHDFRARSGVVGTFIAAPDHAPAWALDRQSLWSAVELHETRSNATTAREWVAALPSELDADQREALARQFAAALVERFGFVTDCAIHAPSVEGDNRNHHLHLMATTREISADGFGAKTRALDTKGSGAVEDVRALWEDLTNSALAAAGSEARIDRRSLVEQAAEAAQIAQEAAQEAAQAQRGLNPIGKRQRVQRAAERAAEAAQRAEGLSREPTTHDGPQRTTVRRRAAKRLARLEKFAKHLEGEIFDRRLSGIQVGDESSAPASQQVFERALIVFDQLEKPAAVVRIAEEVGRGGDEIHTQFKAFMAPAFKALEAGSPLARDWQSEARNGNFAPLVDAFKAYAKSFIGQARLAVAVAFAEHEAPHNLAKNARAWRIEEPDEDEAEAREIERARDLELSRLRRRELDARPKYTPAPERSAPIPEPSLKPQEVEQEKRKPRPSGPSPSI